MFLLRKLLKLILQIYYILLYATMFCGSFLFLYRHYIFFAIKHFNRVAIDHSFTTLVRAEWGAHNDDDKLLECPFRSHTDVEKL